MRGTVGVLHVHPTRDAREVEVIDGVVGPLIGTVEDGDKVTRHRNDLQNLRFVVATQRSPSPRIPMCPPRHGPHVGVEKTPPVRLLRHISEKMTVPPVSVFAATPGADCTTLLGTAV